MRLKNIFLCDAATANHDNTFSVLRGGISNLTIPILPDTDPTQIRPIQVTLVATIELEITEMGKAHNVELSLMDLDGQHVLPKVHANFHPPQSPKKGYFNLIINNILKIDKQGEYCYYVNVDGNELGNQPLSISFKK